MDANQQALQAFGQQVAQHAVNQFIANNPAVNRPIALTSSQIEPRPFTGSIERPFRAFESDFDSYATAAAQKLAYFPRECQLLFRKQ